MSIRYLGDPLGTHYARQWAATTPSNDSVYTMHPTHWASADLTPTFQDLHTSRP